MVKANLDGKFPGGQTLVYNSANNGVGIPATNPNLSDDVVAKVSDVLKKGQSGGIKGSAEKGKLIKEDGAEIRRKQGQKSPCFFLTPPVMMAPEVPPCRLSSKC